jgi:hypothetical protein
MEWRHVTEHTRPAAIEEATLCKFIAQARWDRIPEDSFYKAELSKESAVPGLLFQAASHLHPSVFADYIIYRWIRDGLPTHHHDLLTVSGFGPGGDDDVFLVILATGLRAKYAYHFGRHEWGLVGLTPLEERICDEAHAPLLERTADPPSPIDDVPLSVFNKGPLIRRWLNDFTEFVDIPEIGRMLSTLPASIRRHVDPLGVYLERHSRGNYRKGFLSLADPAAIDYTYDALNNMFPMSPEIWDLVYQFRLWARRDPEIVRDLQHFFEMELENRQHEHATVWKMIRDIPGLPPDSEYTPYIVVLWTTHLDKHVFSFAARRWYIMPHTELEWALSTTDNGE